jgi:hypothetical protein
MNAAEKQTEPGEERRDRHDHGDLHWLKPFRIRDVTSHLTGITIGRSGNAAGIFSPKIAAVRPQAEILKLLAKEAQRAA